MQFKVNKPNLIQLQLCVFLETIWLKDIVPRNADEDKCLLKNESQHTDGQQAHEKMLNITNY